MVFDNFIQTVHIRHDNLSVGHCFFVIVEYMQWLLLESYQPQKGMLAPYAYVVR